MSELFLSLPITFVTVAIALALLLTGLSAVDRLDPPAAPRQTSKEWVQGQSRVRRLFGWLMWAVPMVCIGCALGSLIGGFAGVVVGGILAFVNALGIAALLAEMDFGRNSRKGLIVLGMFQIPVGVLRFVADGF